jgi:membrane-bound lytic murein transglycosylase B
MKKFAVVIAIAVLLLTPVLSFALDDLNQRGIQNYIQKLVKKYHFDEETLAYLFDTVTINKELMRKLSKPAEKMPWYQYEAFLITPERVEKGIAYWKAHEKTLALAEKKYGVPASIMVAIIGIETTYGENKGNYPVFNTLVNLAFNHGRRENFFRTELTEYLLLARENRLEPLFLKGSYAGAIGLPQFMPSSYRHYAVDFYNKGIIDLCGNHADAIGSVGNYLKKHGWQRAQGVAVPASLDEACEVSSLKRKDYKPCYAMAELAQYGIHSSSPLHDKVSFISLEGKNGQEYWLGLQNFYVISTYNNSEHYVMAVNTLAQKLERAVGLRKMARK